MDSTSATYPTLRQSRRETIHGEAPAATVPSSRRQSPMRAEPCKTPSLQEDLQNAPQQVSQVRRRMTKRQHPQKTVDAFWESFASKTPGKPFSILPDNYYAKHAAEHAPQGVKNALASYDEAKASCEAKVAKIVKECRRTNQKYTDPHFNIEADFRMWGTERSFSDCLMGLLDTKTDLRPHSVKRVEDIFEKPRFFIEGATANDVRQGKEGDCWFMSALCTLSNKEGLIQSICVAKDEKVGVYGFVFHRDGEWISEVIDDKLYLIKEDFNDATLERNRWVELQNRTSPEEEYRTVMQMGSRALYFAQCSDPNETWLPLLEKAYAKAHGDYSALESGFVGEGIEDLTGGVTTELFSTDILDKDKFWEEELMMVNKQFLFGCGQMQGRHGMRNGILEKHAYSILEAREVKGERLLKLRNPWGNTEWRGAWSDGSAEWTAEWMQLLGHKFGDDGVFWISYRDLLRNYQHIDRTRLFSHDWLVTQQWTSLDVPWSVDYLDTKFTFTLAKGGEVVIVLQQLDERYFRGLEGQYDFHLQFRLHKDDEDEYIVRSNPAYYMKRSVSSELTLEAGHYTVLVKITAKRYPDPTVEDVIASKCQDRREKLLRIGLSYDLAHAKGDFPHVEHLKKQAEQGLRRQKRRDTAEKMHTARILQHKEQKFRARKIKWKKEAKALAKMQRRADEQAKQEALEKQMTNAKLTEEPESVLNGLGIGNSNTGASQPAKRQDSLPPDQRAEPSPPFRPQVNGSEPRRGTRPSSLSISSLPFHGTSNKKGPQETPPIPVVPSNLSTPGIQIHKPSVSDGDLVLSDISDDELSWDEELYAPEDSDEETFDAPEVAFAEEGARSEFEEYARDPWNAVCVVGLRIYTKDPGVTIDVVRADANHRSTEPAEFFRRGLDVDDANKDPSREPVSPISPNRSPGAGFFTSLGDMLQAQGQVEGTNTSLPRPGGGGGSNSTESKLAADAAAAVRSEVWRPPRVLSPRLS